MKIEKKNPKKPAQVWIKVRREVIALSVTRKVHCFGYIFKRGWGDGYLGVGRLYSLGAKAGGQEAIFFL